MNKSNNIPTIYSLDEQPFGKSWQKWTTQWWKWFFSISKENHPAYDHTGEGWAVNQDDPNVVFLAGTTGGKGRTYCHHSCWKSGIISSDKFCYILF